MSISHAVRALDCHSFLGCRIVLNASVPAALACCRADNGARCAAPSTIPCASNNRRSEKFRSAVNAVVSVSGRRAPVQPDNASLFGERFAEAWRLGIAGIPKLTQVEHELAMSAGFAHRDFAGHDPSTRIAKRAANGILAKCAGLEFDTQARAPLLPHAAPCPFQPPQGTQSNCGRGQSQLDLTSAEA